MSLYRQAGNCVRPVMIILIYLGFQSSVELTSSFLWACLRGNTIVNFSENRFFYWPKRCFEPFRMRSKKFHTWNDYMLWIHLRERLYVHGRGYLPWCRYVFSLVVTIFPWLWSCYLCAFREPLFFGEDERFLFIVLDLAPALLCRDLSKSGSPRFSDSCAVLQRSPCCHPIHSLMLGCNRYLTALFLHCSDLDCSQIELLYWALLAPRGCSVHLFLEQEDINWRRRSIVNTCTKET